MTPIFITWTIPGHFFLVRAVPGAVPTAAASMDGSDGRPDGSPGTGKGLKTLYALTSDARSAPTNVSDSEPSHARYERGKWFYGIWQATPRGRRLRIFPAKHFEASGSDPTLLRRLRQEARVNSVDGNVPNEDHEE